MKSKLLLLLLFCTLGVYAGAQPNNWTESLYDDTKKSVITQESGVKTDGSYSVKYVFTDDGVPYLLCDDFTVTPGASYNLSIDYMDNDPAGAISVRLWFYEHPDSSYLERKTSAATVNSTNWQTLSITGTVPAKATFGYIAVRMSTVSASWAGSAMFYADNARYTENGGTNLIVNGSFESWPPQVIEPNSTVADWTESLYDPNKTSVIEPEATKKTEGNYSVKYTYTDDGTPYFLCDTFDVTAGASYNFSIDYLDNDPSGAISARLWFYEHKDSAYLERKTSTATVDNVNWQTISITGTVPAKAKIAWIAIRMGKAAGWTGSATFYADNAKYTEGTSNVNYIKNPGFETWNAPSGKPEFLTYKFEGLDPVENGVIDKTSKTVVLTVPFATNLSNLVATYTLTENTTAKVGTTDQTSGVTANNFTSPVVYTLSTNGTSADWTVTVEKDPASTEKDIYSFKFEALNPPVTGAVNLAEHKIDLTVPYNTNLTNLVPTITLSEFATVSPATGVAHDFSSPATYTVTAQDGSTQAWTVTVTKGQQGATTLFFQDWESISLIPAGYVIINNDGYTQASGEERWQDSAWVITTTNRIEMQGTKVAMASSYTANMPLNGKADDWLILPAIELGGNSTLSWDAMSTTSSGNYPDDYWVLCAPAVDGFTPTIPYFEENGIVLMKIAPESWSAFVGNPGQGVSHRSVNLKEKEFANQKVWIAFVLNTDLTPGNSSAGGSNLAIDNIKVEDVVSGISEQYDSEFSASVFPNPASREINLAFQSKRQANARISFMDVTGREVLRKELLVNTGFNTLKLDITGLPKGAYVMRTIVNNQIHLAKILVK